MIDAIKAVGMFRKVKIPVIGLIENMSSFICPDNGKQYDIFGKGGAKEYAEQDKIDFLGEIPINIPCASGATTGKMAANFDDPEVAPYLEEIAYNLCQNTGTTSSRNSRSSAATSVGLDLDRVCPYGSRKHRLQVSVKPCSAGSGQRPVSRFEAAPSGWP